MHKIWINTELLIIQLSVKLIKFRIFSKILWLNNISRSKQPYFCIWNKDGELEPRKEEKNEDVMDTMEEEGSACEERSLRSDHDREDKVFWMALKSMFYF